MHDGAATDLHCMKWCGWYLGRVLLQALLHEPPPGILPPPPPHPLHIAQAPAPEGSMEGHMGARAQSEAATASGSCWPALPLKKQLQELLGSCTTMLATLQRGMSPTVRLVMQVGGGSVSIAYLLRVFRCSLCSCLRASVLHPKTTVALCVFIRPPLPSRPPLLPTGLQPFLTCHPCRFGSCPMCLFLFGAAVHLCLFAFPRCAVRQLKGRPWWPPAFPHPLEVPSLGLHLRVSEAVLWVKIAVESE
jgi:hypothetical protein